jgi:CheY-like chemotaxis protein
MMPKQLEIWGAGDPNISAQLALATRLNLFKQEAGLEVSCRFFESGTTITTEILKAEHKPFAFAQTPITAIQLHDNGYSTKGVAPLADIAGTQQVVIHPRSGIVHPKDLAMPGMSGIDAIERILQIDPETNIIVISGTDHKELREEVFNLGAKIFIVKPFDPLYVAEIIGLLLL